MADREHDIIEVTTYRTETGYSDNRHPDTVQFTPSLKEDLRRRDFTMNAIALRLNFSEAEESYQLVDPFNGQKTIQDKVIHAVGDPNERFQEDALRLMRAIRFYAELRTPDKLTQPEPLFDNISITNEETPVSDWHIESVTLEALKNNADRIKYVSWERIRDEFAKIILSGSPAEGIDLLQKAGLLRHIRLAALFHDIGKPRTKRGNDHHSTFYNHDHVGARMTRPILNRLRFPAKVVDHATLLVDNHLFYYNVGEVTEASVRRLIARVGLENMDDLMAIRIGDRLGSGTPKAKPYRLRHLEYMIDRVSHDAVSVKMLKANGNDLMKELHIAPGPKIGAILDVLLAEVIEDADRNTHERLLARTDNLKDEDLAYLRTLAKSTIENKRAAEDQDIKKKHWVQ